MNAAEWLTTLALGGLLGALGQVVRVTVGLKKLGEEAQLAGKERSDLFSTARLLVSLAIGFTAGAIAALLAEINFTGIEPKVLMPFVAAGYAGTDFIEGVMSKFVPSSTVPASVATSGEDHLG